MINTQRVFLLIIFLVVFYWVLKLYQPFLMVITIASLLSLATYNINNQIENIFKNRTISALVSTILLFILFFAPIVYTITSIGNVVNNFEPQIVDKTLSYIKSFDFTLPQSIDFLQEDLDKFIKDLDLTKVTTVVLSYLGTLGKNSANFLKDMVLILVFYFFALLNGKELGKYFRSILPLTCKEIDTIFSEISNVMSVVFYSILATAIFEGSLFAIIGMIFGYDGLLLGIFYGFASLIPIIGGALMWVPLSAYEFANGNYVAGFSIAIYSVVVISIIADTFIKPLIIKYINSKLVTVGANVNEILIFFAILAGLSTFGFWGMILGPAITTLFISLTKLLKILKEQNFSQ